MTSTESQPTFWELTVRSAKEAVQLYFEPVPRITIWTKERLLPLMRKPFAMPKAQGVTLDVILEIPSAEITHRSSMQKLELWGTPVEIVGADIIETSSLETTTTEIEFPAELSHLRTH